MKKLLFIIGIASIVACVLSVLYAAFSLYGYYHVLDGSAELYSRLHLRMILFFIFGAAFAVITAVSFLIRTKL